MPRERRTRFNHGGGEEPDTAINIDMLEAQRAECDTKVGVFWPESLYTGEISKKDEHGAYL